MMKRSIALLLFWAAPVLADIGWDQYNLTVAELPASCDPGRIYGVADGADAEDCTTGAGSTSVACKCNGAGNGYNFLSQDAHTAAFTPNADPGVDHSSYVAGHGDGANCSAGEYPLGVDAAGAAQTCTDATTEINSAVSTHAGVADAHFVHAANLTALNTQISASLADGAHFAPSTLDSDYGNETITSDFDFGGGTLQVPNSITLPGTCEVGDSYMDTDATSGQRWYLCESANNWVQQGGAGSFSSFDITDTDASPILTVDDGEQIQFIGAGTVTIAAAADASNHDVTITGSAHTADQVGTVNDGDICQGGAGSVLDCDVTQNAGTDITADLEEEAQVGSTNVTGNAVDNSTLVGTGANAAGYVTLPSCSDEAQTLGWNTTTGAWVCNADAGAGGGMTSWTVQGDDTNTATITDGETMDIAGGLGLQTTVATGSPEQVTVDWDYSQTLAGNPALGIDECILSTDGSGGGLLCEGTAADTAEGLLVFPVTTSDKTVTLPDATTTLVGTDTTDTLTNKTIDATNTVTINASDITDQNAGTDVTADLEEEAHASEHQHGGGDEVATATAGANAIPKAGAGGTLGDAWIDGAAEVDEITHDSLGTPRTATQYTGSGSTTNEVDLATAEAAGILPIAKGGLNADNTAVVADGEILVYDGVTNNAFESVPVSGGHTLSAAGSLDHAADAVDAITEIATALKSGSDATLVTGTSGTSGHCAQWNADGDLVTTGVACAGGGTDSIGTDELDDGTDTPAVNQLVRVDSASTAQFEYGPCTMDDNGAVDCPAHPTQGGSLTLKEDAGETGSNTYVLKIPDAGGLSANKVCTLEADGDIPSDCLGVVAAADGGTGGDSSGSTGVPLVTAGTWSYDADPVDLAGVTTITDGSFCQGAASNGFDCDVLQTNIPGADHVDAMSEIAAGIKRGPDATDTHLLTTDVAAPAGARCLEMDTDGSVILASDTCANLGPGGTPTQIVAGDSDMTVTDAGTGSIDVTMDASARFTFTGAVFRGANAAGPQVTNQPAAATTPTFSPNRADTDTGIGSAAADQLSLIAGGVEGIRITEATTAQVQLGSYGSGTITGTDAFWLAVDASGNIIEEAAPAGTGDIQDVFDCTTGDCNQVTVESSEYLRVSGSGSVEATITTIPATTSAGTSSIATTNLVYISNAYDAVNGCVEVELADADSAATMPAIGVVTATVNDGNCNGEVTVTGLVVGVEIGAFSAGDALYVSGTAGDFTSTKPTGTALIQRIGQVVQNTGAGDDFQMFGAGRSNDVPNIADDSVWVGSASGVATAETLPDSDGAGQKLVWDQATNAFSAGTDETCSNTACTLDSGDSLSGTPITLSTTTGPTTDGAIAWDATNDELEVGETSTTAIIKQTGTFNDEQFCSAETTGNQIDCDTATTGTGSLVRADSPTLTTAVTLPTDSVDTGELDDGTDTPVEGEVLAVSSTTSEVNYVPPAAICKTLFDSGNLAATDDITSIYRWGSAAIITEAWCEVGDGTNVQIDLNTSDGADDVTSNCVCTTSGVSCSLTDTTMIDGELIDLTIDSISGSVTRLTVCMEFRYDL